MNHQKPSGCYCGRSRIACGKAIEELKFIIDAVEDKERIRVPLDTCHLFSAGYNIQMSHLNKFDQKVGLKYLKAVHLNDSMNEFNSKKDRHESIEMGKIGLDAFKYIMNSEYFEDMPMVLETPRPEKYAEETALLKALSSMIKSIPGT